MVRPIIRGKSYVGETFKSTKGGEDGKEGAQSTPHNRRIHSKPHRRVNECDGDFSTIEPRRYCSRPKSRSTRLKTLPTGDSAWLPRCESKKGAFYLGLNHLR